MRSLFEKKPLVLVLSILALGALTVLSVSLRSVSFRDAQPIGRGEADVLSVPAQAVTEPLHEVSLRSQIILWVSLGMLVVLVGVLLSPEARRKVIRIFIRVALAYWGLYYLLKNYPEILTAFNFGLWGAPSQKDIATADVLPPVFTPPRETPLLSYLISLTIILGAVFLLWKFYRAWMDLKPSSRTAPLQEIARVARSSLRDLSSGRESTDVILNCYFRMSDVVANKKNLQRGMSVTPAEFASRLVQAGLPSDAVRRLTSLFETVRYGDRKAGPKDVNEAVACLTAIAQHCGESI
jgi:hypothetical protein